MMGRSSACTESTKPASCSARSVSAGGAASPHSSQPSARSVRQPSARMYASTARSIVPKTRSRSCDAQVQSNGCEDRRASRRREKSALIRIAGADVAAGSRGRRAPRRCQPDHTRDTGCVPRRRPPRGPRHTPRPAAHHASCEKRRAPLIHAPVWRGLARLAELHVQSQFEEYQLQGAGAVARRRARELERGGRNPCPRRAPSSTPRFCQSCRSIRRARRDCSSALSATQCPVCTLSSSEGRSMKLLAGARASRASASPCASSGSGATQTAAHAAAPGADV